jgi:hypothetical protein
MEVEGSVPTVEPPKYRIEDISTLFNSGTIIFSATHGEYDLKSKLLSATVPDNTLVFETTNIGDFCMDTIDKYLWELAQGKRRTKFWNILNPSAAVAAGGGGGGGGSTEEEGKYRDAVSQLIMYGPGDTIPIRTLSIGSNSRRDMMMGFYKLSGSSDYPYLLGGTAKTMHDFDISLRDESASTTNIAVINRGNQLATVGPKIYIFVSCASHTKLKGTVRWTQIANIQQSARLNALSLGITTLSGGSNAPSRFSNNTESSMMATSSMNTNALMMAVGNIPVRESASLCESGYGVLLLEKPGKITPYQINGKFCLTRDQVSRLEKSPEYHIYAITEYEDGLLVGAKVKVSTNRVEQGGGYRRTMRRRKRRLNKSKRNRGNARR